MPTPVSRRLFLRRFASLSALGGGSAAGAFGYGSLVERHWIGVERRSITLPGLVDGMDGFRIAQISDLHLDPWTKGDTIEAAVAQTNALRADLVVITGDMLTNSSKPAGLLAELLSRLEAPHGVFAIMGNNDVWNQPWIIKQRLAEKQIQVLQNEGAQLSTERGDLFIAGLDSAWGGRADIHASLRDWKRRDPLIVLAHEPDIADTVAKTGVKALQLSGHTHGGQVCLPSPWPLALHLPRWGKKYAHGLHRVGGIQLYVNRGIGCVGVPVRFACPPEITEITLRSRCDAPHAGDHKHRASLPGDLR